MKQYISKILLQNVEHIYYDTGSGGQIKALGGITLSVFQGEIISIVGVSGSGKTTLLNAIAGFLRCTGGKVLLNGKEVMAPGNDRVVVFQDNNAVFPWYSVEKNVRYGLLGLSEVSKQEANIRIDTILSAVGLDQRRSSYPKHLSGGEKKRVELARAFVIRPEVILADEPFRDMDAITKLRLQELLLSLWEKESNTIVLVTHDVEEALLLSDRIAILSAPPATIKEIIQVPFLRPRKINIRTQPDFTSLREKVESLLNNH